MLEGIIVGAGVQSDEETSRRPEAIYATPDVVAQRETLCRHPHVMEMLEGGADDGQG